MGSMHLASFGGHALFRHLRKAENSSGIGNAIELISLTTTDIGGGARCRPAWSVAMLPAPSHLSL